MKKRLLLLIVLLLVVSLVSKVHAGIFTVPSWLLNSSVFIMKGDKAEGTGFLLWLEDNDRTFCYLVTAKHVVKPILSNPNSPLAVRFNLKDNKKAEIITFPTFVFNDKRWLEHSNPAVDIAIIPLTIFGRISELEIGGIKRVTPSDDFFATSEWLDKYKVGPGDQVFTLGLVPYLYSKDQINLVLTRFGNISLLPKGELDLPGGKQKAYFIDCQAFGGNSGGPAFVLIERTESGALIAGWRFALLGVVTQFVPSPLRMEKINLQESVQKEAIQLIENTGITKIVPVDYVIDIIFSKEQKEFRKKIALAEEKKSKGNSSK